MSRRASCTMLLRAFVRLTERPQVLAALVIAGMVLIGSSYGQNSRLKKMQEAAASSAAGAAAAANPAPSAPQVSQPAPNQELPSVEETIPEPPVISWDGKELTIDADNATLSSILLGIRSRTGASIEMPLSTGSERVAVHLGPAPMREVISSLLYGTDFNYVIQSSDEDENGRDKVIITAKDGDTSDDTSSSTATAAASDRRVRLMPGYGAPGKRDFEVAHQKAAEAAQEDDSSTAGLTITQDPTPDPPADNTRADSSSAAPASTDSANAATPVPDAGLQVAAQTQTATSSSATSSSMGDSGSALSKMEQDLQHMYQQRQQIQAQQNRSPQAQSTTN